MQMRCDASSKHLARATAKSKSTETIAKMSKLGWYKPALGPWQRMNGDNVGAESERYTWWRCQGCSKAGYTRYISQLWLCEDCRLRETASYVHSWFEDASGWRWNSWNTWRHDTWTGNDEDGSTWPAQSALMDDGTPTNRVPTSRAKSRPRRGRDTPEQHTCEASESIPAPNLGAGATEPSGDATTCSSAATETTMCREMIPTDVAREPREGSSLGSTPVITHADTVGVDTTCDRTGSHYYDVVVLKNNPASSDRRRQASHGGAAAHKAQQALRQYCLQNRSWCVTLNEDDKWPLSEHPQFDWKRTLLVMPEHDRKQLIADGIVYFQFLLLRNVKDQNYPKPPKQTQTHDSVPDTGERHVFEITQRDGTKWHLHYHKNGKHDSPYKIPPHSSIWDIDKHDSPRWFSLQSILQSTPEHNTPLGTEELCKALRKICPDAGSTRDITDMQAVHWHRWLQNVDQSMAAMYIGTGIERVFAFSSTGRDYQPVPTIVFAHPNNTYTSVDFAPTRNGWRRQEATHEDWKGHRMFASAIKESTSWLRIPDAW